MWRLERCEVAMEPGRRGTCLEDGAAHIHRDWCTADALAWRRDGACCTRAAWRSRRASRAETERAETESGRDELVDAELAVGVDLLVIRFPVEDHDVGLALPTCLGPQFPQRPYAAGDVLGDRGGHPAVGAAADPPEVLLGAGRSHEGERAGSAGGLGPGPAQKARILVI